MKTYNVIVIETIERRLKVPANSKTEAERNWESGHVYHQERTDLFIPLAEEITDKTKVQGQDEGSGEVRPDGEASHGRREVK